MGTTAQARQVRHDKTEINTSSGQRATTASFKRRAQSDRCMGATLPHCFIA